MATNRIAEVLSSNGRTWYVVSFEDTRREWQCGCKGWTSHTPRRDCRHIKSTKRSVQFGVEAGVRLLPGRLPAAVTMTSPPAPAPRRRGWAPAPAPVPAPRSQALTTLAAGFNQAAAVAALERAMNEQTVAAQTAAAAITVPPAPPAAPTAVCSCCGERHTDKWCRIEAVRAKAAAEQPTQRVELEVD